ncbi:M28 family peptidase [Novipirellula aureliae]|nr:M28 family peptidase [Novipirellula aureliae]
MIKQRKQKGSERRDTQTTKTSADAGIRKWLFRLNLLFGVVIVLFVAALVTRSFNRSSSNASGVPVESPTVGPIPSRYDADRAFGYLEQLCAIGRRPSGSEGMQEQQTLLTKFFEERDAVVSMQTFQIRHPEDGSNVEMANLIARWNPESEKRFLFCAHYDTLPFPEQDPVNPRGYFVGANDGASGTAALMELANQFKDLPANIGVDIVLFDGEEFVFDSSRDDFFLGSTFFAKKYAATEDVVPYRAGILLDMVGDKELKLYYEKNSLRYAREVARGVWSVAARLGVTAFTPRSRHEILDDHLPLNQIAKIPTIDIIDFDYPRPGFGAPRYWHTEQDVPANCSGKSMTAVVWVVHQWLLQEGAQ